MHNMKITYYKVTHSLCNHHTFAYTYDIWQLYTYKQRNAQTMDYSSENQQVFCLRVW